MIKKLTVLIIEGLGELFGQNEMDVILIPSNKQYAYANTYTIDMFPAFRPINFGPKHRE